MPRSEKRPSKANSRPRKKLRERKRRLKVQQKRLRGMGVSEEAIRTMNPRDVRAMLRRLERTRKKNESN